MLAQQAAQHVAWRNAFFQATNDSYPRYQVLLQVYTEHINSKPSPRDPPNALEKTKKTKRRRISRRKQASRILKPKKRRRRTRVKRDKEL